MSGPSLLLFFKGLGGSSTPTVVRRPLRHAPRRPRTIARDRRLGQLFQTDQWLGDGLKFDTDNQLDVDVGGVFPIVDTTNIVKDPDDATKTMRIDVGAVAAGATRVLTMPDRDVDLSVAVVDDGSTATPAVRFNSDPDTGIYRKASNALSISCGGTDIIDVDANGMNVTGSLKVGEIKIATNIGILLAKSYSNAGRPSAGTAGRVIFNTDDGQLNIDTGSVWTLPDGTTT